MKNFSSSKNVFFRGFVVVSQFSVCCLMAGVANAEPISPALQTKVSQYKKKMQEWAASAAVVGAVKEANSKGGVLPGMSVGKWDALDEADPIVKSLQISQSGKALSDFSKDKGINKLYLRDEKGNLVASTSKPLLFNNVSRPQFASCIKGNAPWSDGEVKSDPSTGVKGVHICVPVVDAGKAIGVLHSSVNAD